MGSQHGFPNALNHPDEGNPFRSYTMASSKLGKFVNLPKSPFGVDKSEGKIKDAMTTQGGKDGKSSGPSAANNRPSGK